MIFWLFVGLCFIAWWCLSLSGRVRDLEEKMGVRATVQQPAPASTVQHATEPPHMQEVTLSAPPPPPPISFQNTQSVTIPHPSPQGPNPLIAWFAENTLIKIGAFLFFLGAVWFVSYAISQGWISPAARITLGILAGIVLNAVGFWRKSVLDHYRILTVLGSGVIIASVFAGQFIFQLFVPAFALFIIVSTIGYVVWVSVETKTQWLAVLSAITALWAPMLIGPTEPNYPFFFTYLLGMSTAFLAVVFQTHWRAVTFTLLLGNGLFLWAAYLDRVMSFDVLWVFICLFSALFYIASTISMVRSNIPHTLDVLTLTLASGSFIVWVANMTEMKGLITFTSAFIAAGTGYFISQRQGALRITLLYVALASVLSLVATAFVFDGYALTLMYTLEISGVILLALLLNFPPRALRLASFAFVLPVAISIENMFDERWNASFFHPSAYALYLITLATITIATVALLRARDHTTASVGNIFLILFWVYAHITSALVIESAVSGDTASVWRYVVWTLITIGTMVYGLILKRPARTFAISLIGFTVPVLTSLSTLRFEAESWYAFTSCGVYFMTLVTFCVGVWLVMRARRFDIPYLLSGAAIFFGVGWIYALISASLVVLPIMHSTAWDTVATYLMWLLVSGFLFGLFYALRMPLSWLIAGVATVMVPAAVAVPSFFSVAWSSSWTHPHALGLYEFTFWIFVFGYIFYSFVPRRYQDLEDVISARGVGIAFFSAGGVFLAGLIWQISGAVFTSPDWAISAALLVYTVAGLILYMVGRNEGMLGLRYAGITVLSGVVARLLIVDVWNMDILGRVITFLGVGILFIITALFEKPFEKLNKKQ